MLRAHRLVLLHHVIKGASRVPSKIEHQSGFLGEVWHQLVIDGVNKEHHKLP